MAGIKVYLTELFDRADGPLGNGWTTLAGTPPVLKSNAWTIDPSGNTGQAYRPDIVPPANQWAACRIKGLPNPANTDVNLGPAIRCSPANGGSCYMAFIGTNRNFGPGYASTVELWKKVNGVDTFLGLVFQDLATPLTVGDTILLKAVGSTITLQIYSSGFNSGAILQFQITDTAVTGGSPGLSSNRAPGANPFSQLLLFDRYAAGSFEDDSTKTQRAASTFPGSGDLVASDPKWAYAADANPSTMTVSANKVVPVGQAGFVTQHAYRTSEAYTDDQYSQATALAGNNGNTQYMGVAVRAKSNGTFGAQVGFSTTGDTPTLSDGTSPFLAKFNTWLANDVVSIESHGIVFALFANGTFFYLATSTAGNQSGGTPAIYEVVAGGQAGDFDLSTWSGGDFVPPAPGGSGRNRWLGLALDMDDGR